MSLPVVTAADGGAWEATLLGRLAASDAVLTVVRRCVDVVELAAVAASGQVVAALVDAQLRHLDADLVHRVAASGVAVVGVLGPDTAADTERLRTAGISFAVAAEADPAVVVDVVRQALAETLDAAGAAGGWADPAGAAASGRAWPTDAGSPVAPGPGDASATDGPALIAGDSRSSRTIAVWGPTGAPGRTTVAVNLACEIARLGLHCLLVDADLYGGVVANVLGVLDESPGLVAACRQAQGNRLDPAALAGLCWQFEPTLRVLTGVARAERWPEVRPDALQQVLAISHRLADCTVLDLGFCLETDEELSFDTIAPRRNGATLAALEAADLVLAVGSADPVGMQRLIRGLDELTALQLSAPVWVVLNRVRAESVPGKPEVELDAALQRFAGRAAQAFLPYDRLALDRAVVTGKTLAEVAGNSPLRTALVRLAAAAAGLPSPARGRRRLQPASRRGDRSAPR